MTYHQEIPVNDFRISAPKRTCSSTGGPLDSAFRNRNLRRQYDAPMNAFLYVEPYEVRAEIIARPLDMQRWMDLGMEGSKHSGRAAVRHEQKATAFLSEHQNLMVDGNLYGRSLDRVNFLRRTLRTSTVVTHPRSSTSYRPPSE